MKTASVFGCVFLLAAAAVSAQETGPALAKLRAMHLPELSGSVPAIYVPAAKERAIEYQKSLEAACAWRRMQHSSASLTAGLDELWTKTLGDARVSIALLDGPVDVWTSWPEVVD